MYDSSPDLSYGEDCSDLGGWIHDVWIVSVTGSGCETWSDWYSTEAEAREVARDIRPQLGTTERISVYQGSAWNSAGSID